MMAGRVVFRIGSCDEMNVDEISGGLRDLSVEACVSKVRKVLLACQPPALRTAICHVSV
jgi:hypothetical protein